jgi:hypothetical protein
MKIEVLYVRDCPSHRAAVKLVNDILASTGLTAYVEEVFVSNQRMAVALKFPGSPTIRINGRDVAGELPVDQAFGLSCRLYPGSEQRRLPPAGLISRAVAAAAEGGAR